MKVIAIQGIKGSFHHIAAIKYFYKNPFKILECDSFKKLVEMLVLNKADLGVMAIENSIVGSILTNYNLISENNIKILGEIYIHIEQHLMALSGQRIDTLHEISSHPMALQQCSDFFHKYQHIKMSECSDTAQAAYNIVKKHLTSIGAIASSQAAKEYKLEILAQNIHNVPNNYTRFLIISFLNSQEIIGKFDKVSLNFKIPNQIRSLSKILNIISEKNINIIKLQSVPIIERPWDYSFYIDLLIKDLDAYACIKSKFEKQECKFSILGQYKNGWNL